MQDAILLLSTLLLAVLIIVHYFVHIIPITLIEIILAIVIGLYFIRIILKKRSKKIRQR